MKFTINAEKCQAIVNEISKGVGNNKLLPITSMIGIELNEDVLQFISTNGANTLRITTNDVNDGKEGYATVNADMFTGLIGKLSDCSTLIFEVTNKILAITGKCGAKTIGTFKLELPVDENGNAVRFPNFSEKVNATLTGSAYTITLENIEEMRNSCKQALSMDISESCYANYLIGDKIVATDRTRAVFVDENIPQNEPHFLLGRNFVDLMALMEDDVALFVSENGMYAHDNHGTEIFANVDGDLEDYNEAAINGMLGLKFTSMCKIKKSDLINTLNRMTLFCSKFDNNGIDIYFKDDKMVIKSLKESAVEEIEYSEYANVKPSDIRIDVTLLISHIKSYSSDMVELYFGNPTCIKLVDGNVTQIIALVRK